MIFKLNSCSLDSDRVRFFFDRRVESGSEGSEETDDDRRTCLLVLSWATSKWRPATSSDCVGRLFAGQLLTVAAAAGWWWCLSLDLDAKNGCWSRRSNATEERWNTMSTRFISPAILFVDAGPWILLEQAIIHFVASRTQYRS